MPNKELSFNMERQQADYWCWAANAASVSKFYDPSSEWTQCAVANVAFPGKTCCVDKQSCDEPWFLDKALAITSNFQVPLVSRALRIQEIRQQIDQQLVICVRIGWRSGGGHFVAIYGYNNEGPEPFVYVDDPLSYGKSFIKLSSFSRNYQQNGVWTHTYFTKDNGSKMVQFSKIDKNIFAKAMVAREQLTNSLGQLEKSAIDSDMVGQEVYSISLSNLLAGGDIRPRREGFRIVSDVKTGVVYEFDGNNGDASLERVFHDTAYNSIYSRAMSIVRKEELTFDDDFVLHVVRVPELKVEAFWLHNFSDVVKDKFLPILGVGQIQTDRLYKRSAFFRGLRTEARKKQNYEDPLLGG